MEQRSSASTQNLSKAMLQVQHQLRPVVKNARNGFIGNRYATLSAVIEACRGPLLGNGIVLSQFPVPSDDRHLCLETRLEHAESGEWFSSQLMMPLVSADAQSVGSALTYARRYAICAMLGLSTEDDDAEVAMGRGPVPVRQRPPMPPAPRPAQRPSPAPAPQASQQSASSNPAPRPQQQAPVQSPQPSVQQLPAQPGIQRIESNSQNRQPERLPELPGVDYSKASDRDGKPIILARGRTLDYRDELKRHGFHWSPERRAWWTWDFTGTENATRSDNHDA